MVGVALAAALAAPAVPSFAQNAPAANGAATPGAKRIKLRTGCDKPGDSLRPQCRGFTRAEPNVVPYNKLFQFLWMPLVAGSGVATAVLGKNSKNCGKGNNSQNNGNCPASP